MLDYTSQSSITSLNSRCSSTKSGRSVWSKISKIFHSRSLSSSQSSTSSRRISGNYSTSNLSQVSSKSDSDSSLSHRRHIKQLVHADEGSPQMMIPPFSPTYLKANEFPYSNFYMKLPDGRWMVRYRDGNRDILRTDIMEGYMI